MKYITLFLFYIFLSCKPVEIIDPIVFDNSQLAKISINAKNINIVQKYESKFVDPYIDHSLLNPPTTRLISWIQTNINTFGKENKLEINILDASIKKIETKNKEAKKYEEKDIFYYEIFYLVEYNLYDDTNYLIASTIVESFRSTTSGRFISIIETEKIIDNIILDSLRDVSNESKKLINQYMANYIL